MKAYLKGIGRKGIEVEIGIIEIRTKSSYLGELSKHMYKRSKEKGIMETNSRREMELRK